MSHSGIVYKILSMVLSSAHTHKHIKLYTVNVSTKKKFLFYLLLRAQFEFDAHQRFKNRQFWMFNTVLRHILCEHHFVHILGLRRRVVVLKVKCFLILAWCSSLFSCMVVQGFFVSAFEIFSVIVPDSKKAISLSQHFFCNNRAILA